MDKKETTLKRVRASKGFTQRSLAEATGISIRTIQHWECGDKDFNQAAAMTVYEVSQALGVDMLDLLDVPKPEKVESDGGNICKKPILYFATKDAQAAGQQVQDGFVIFKGSRIAPTMSNSCPSYVVKGRQELAEHIENNVLLDDIWMPSSSAAACFVSGASRSGTISWKTAEGITLKELEDKEKTQNAPTKQGIMDEGYDQEISDAIERGKQLDKEMADGSIPQ